MMQYLEIKEQYQDTIIMFRLGDFYEMFFDDAVLVSKELQLTLTGRDAGAKERVPMCGVPHHASKAYIQKLVDHGHKVAIVEQLEDPSQAAGIVKRGVIQIITPGTVMDLDVEDNNFIAAYLSFDLYDALAFCDLMTGELMVESFPKNKNQVENEFGSFHVKEVVSISSDVQFPQLGVMLSVFDDDQEKSSYTRLFKHITDFKQIKVASLLLNYLTQTQKRELDYIQEAKVIETGNFLEMDLYAKTALELTCTLRTKEKTGSLLWLLDHTKTSMGSRLLKQWLDKPLIDEQEINHRLDLVSLFSENFIERESIKEILKECYDLERLACKVSYGNVNAKDLLWIGKTLKVVPELRHQLQSLNHPLSLDLASHLVDLSHLTDVIDRAFVDNPPLSIKEGGMFKPGFDETLDTYLEASTHGKQWILDFEAKEKERTGIRNLKVGYNKVFGYYIEVTRSYLSQITDDMHYTRKQSLANAERFVTPELKEMEQKILNAQDKIVKLEYELFNQVRAFIKQDVYLMQDVSKAIAMIDVYISFAHLASQNRYVRPSFNHNHVIDIKNGRHGVVEEVMKKEKYVENDLSMGKDQHLLMITGPNMGGKSTYMRQVALMVVMAQIGCFVPASYANLPIFDKLFTRIGASDDLISGKSTFMVEMMEANRALRHATKDSLLIFDELGRGTATFDGMAIAQAMVEYISQELQCKALFSTHYHELTLLAKKIPAIKNIHAGVVEKDHQIVFQYKMMPGAASKSYGINVARLALLPETILNRASVILEELENNNIEHQVLQSKPMVIREKSEVECLLEKMNPLTMTPLEAISTLMELKKMLK